MQYAFRFDVTRCAQCFACEVACKSEHLLAPLAQAIPGSTGPRYRQVITTYDVDAECPIQYVSIACMHCGSPACMQVCPAKAIYRDDEFGAVLVNRDRCIGCRSCLWACDFGAPQFGADGLMQKCNMCIDRLRAGRKPACVENCCGGALTLAPVNAVEQGVREKAAARFVHSGLGEMLGK